MTDLPKYSYSISELREMIFDSLSILHCYNEAAVKRDINATEELLDEFGLEDAIKSGRARYISVFLLEAIYFLKKHEDIAGKDIKISTSKSRDELVRDLSLVKISNILANSFQGLEDRLEREKQQEIEKKMKILKERDDRREKAKAFLRNKHRNRPKF